MSLKKSKLRYKKERVVLSEILPYEIPLIFSNRHFYNFLIENKIEFRNESVVWKKTNDDSLTEIIRLLFGIKKDIEAKLEKGSEELLSFKIEKVSIPFSYKISHKENEYRELAICHPRNQLQIIDFYERFRELIIYYSNISPFSIRKPYKVAKFTFHKDRTHYKNLSDEKDRIQEHHKEYENLKSFFVYKDYSNIYKFYESKKFHHCEKRYNKLLKLDISKCFSSIYTHSIAWALMNKESVKENISASKRTFAGLFDSLMQEINYNETNGIIIAADFSRIFAELILQSIDRDLEIALERYGLKHKSHYEIFRYVDDYFVFFNEDKTKDIIVENLQHHLKDYKLHLNTEKQIIYKKPIVTDITIAKQRIRELLNEKLAFKLEESESEGTEKKLNGVIRIQAASLITQFKIILKECNVEYREVLNYTFGIIEKSCETIIVHYAKNDKNEKQLVKAILEIIEFIFFIYAGFPRVTSSVRLCRVLGIFISFIKIKNNNIDLNNKESISMLIFENINFILEKNKQSHHIQVETLYLILVLSELGNQYQLSQQVLFRYCGFENDSNKNTSFNYFSITALIFYIKNSDNYLELREKLEKNIKEKFEKNKNTIRKNTEVTLLLMDCLTCPYLTSNFKKELLKIYNVNENMHEKIIQFNLKRRWFINWSESRDVSTEKEYDFFNFLKELDAKRGKEVY